MGGYIKLVNPTFRAVEKGNFLAESRENDGQIVDNLRENKVQYIHNNSVRCAMNAIGGGCGSVIGGGFVILMVAALVIGSLILSKRKSDN